MRDGASLRRIGLGLCLAVLLIAAQGCTNFERQGCTGPFSYAGAYLKNRLKDGLEVVDVGVTVSSEPQFSFYAALLSVLPVGYGYVDGDYIGIGGGDLGAMPIYYEHIGLGLWGREQVGWGDCLFDFGGFDPERPETMHRQGVGLLGFLLPPYDRRPASAPT